MEETIDVPDLKIFVAVVRFGSFTAAAKALASNKAHVSRVVSRLEKRLGVQLLQRSTRRLNVTETGQELFERAVGILTALEETQASISRSQGEPQGLLRIAASFEFGIKKVDFWISEYVKRYPKVRIEVDYSNRIADVIHEGIDVAIRVGFFPDSELSQRKLGEIRYALYASPQYLSKKTEPVTPEQLYEHDLIMFTPRGKPVWELINGNETTDITADAKIVVNNNISALHASSEGLGIALLPTIQTDSALSQGKLVRILKDWERITVPVHAVFSSSRYMAPKVRAFIDLASQNFD